MKHPSSRLVLNHWTDRRRHRPAPYRTDIDPGSIRQALGDTFMLAADFVGTLRFRLAGTRVCALFCSEIKGWTFADLWDDESRNQLDQLLTPVSEDNAAVVAGVTGETGDGSQLELELLLLPIAHLGGARIRALGVLAPMQPPYWLGESPILELKLRSVRYLGDDAHTPRIVPAGAHQKHGFVVYPGGLQASNREPTV